MFLLGDKLDSEDAACYPTDRDAAPGQSPLSDPTPPGPCTQVHREGAGSGASSKMGRGPERRAETSLR